MADIAPALLRVSEQEDLSNGAGNEREVRDRVFNGRKSVGSRWEALRLRVLPLHLRGGMAKNAVRRLVEFRHVEASERKSSG